MRCSREGTTFRSHLLHLSIDFSGRKGGRPVPDGMQGRWLAWYGWTSPPLLQPCTFLKEPSPRPRTGIKFNCLPVAFGRVRNREEQLFRSSGLVVPSKRDVTSRRVTFLLVGQQGGGGGGGGGGRGRGLDDDERKAWKCKLGGEGESRERSLEKEGEKGWWRHSPPFLSAGERNKSWPCILFRKLPSPNATSLPSFPRPPSETLCPRAFFN